MDDSLNKIALNLLEATVSLYPADATGAPVTDADAPLWTGARAEGLKAAEKWVVIETRPTGAQYPAKHPLAPQYDIGIDRVWALELSDLIGFQAAWTNYVLDVLWVEEETQQWHRRTFYGVTISERSLDSRSIEAGFTDDNRFAAQYFIAASGPAADPPPVLPPAPVPLYQVYHQGITGAPVLVYTYDPAEHTFAPVGDPSGRVIIASEAGALSVTFAGDNSAALATGVGALYRGPVSYNEPTPLYYQSGNFTVRGGVLAGPPARSDLPRLDFCYGPHPALANGVMPMRVCTLTRTGLFATQFVQEPPSLADGVFALFGGTQLKATLGPQVATQMLVVADIPQFQQD